MSIQAFMCLKHEIKHTVSGIELPLEFADVLPWQKHGYNIFVELPNGDLCKVVGVHDGSIEFINEETGQSGHCPLRDVQ